MRVLITGKNGYIGNKTADWLRSHEGGFEVDFLDMKDSGWKDKSFNDYDCIIHAAGIAHVNSNDKDLYDKVNTVLAHECAMKALKDGVRHFVFISSVYVYGAENGLSKKNIIDENTPEKPATFYGESKLNAEKLIAGLRSDAFTVSILRIPMVYGPGCKGNYVRLSKLSKKIFLFPKLDNQRSMIFVDNLTEFLRLLLINPSNGVFYPQNREYVNTSKLVYEIAKCNNKKVAFTGIFNPLIKLMSKGHGKIAGLINKLFGNYMIDGKLSAFYADYNICDFETSVKLSEGKETN